MQSILLLIFSHYYARGERGDTLVSGTYASNWHSPKNVLRSSVYAQEVDGEHLGESVPGKTAGEQAHDADETTEVQREDC